MYLYTENIHLPIYNATEKIIVEQMATIKTNSETAAENQESATKNGSPVRLLLDIHQAAETLSMSPVSVRKLLRQGRLQRLPDFRKVLIPQTSLQKFAQTATAA